MTHLINISITSIKVTVILSKAMSQTKEDIELDLAEFKAANTDWKSVEWKANTVASFNNRLASLGGNETNICSILTPSHDSDI